ncbi:MAG: YigZ family protein [Tissierellia bacterium]|nr:YigZ family protein [Tissierellia bacterium]
MYKTIFQPGIGEIEIKKSKFIGYLKPVTTEEEAEDFITAIRKEHPSARHHCTAFILGEKGMIQRYDDDKEPSGTAGVPILDVLKKEELTNICAVVVRYFGGTLLGTGGLVRAYTKATQLALENANIVMMKPYKKIEIRFLYPIYGELEYYVHTNHIPITNIEYTDTISCTLYISLEKWKKFQDYFAQITAGEGEYLLEEDILLPESQGILVKEAIPC